MADPPKRQDNSVVVTEVLGSITWVACLSAIATLVIILYPTERPRSEMESFFAVVAIPIMLFYIAGRITAVAIPILLAFIIQKDVAKVFFSLLTVASVYLVLYSENEALGFDYDENLIIVAAAPTIIAIRHIFLNVLRPSRRGMWKR